MYKVIQRFRDGENGKPFTKAEGGATYEIGDAYPLAGINPTNEHIDYLLSCNYCGRGSVIEGLEDADKKPEKSKTDKKPEDKAKE